MRLNKSFITQESDGEQIMVSTGESGFVGLVRSNATAAFIINSLKKETTREEIVKAMCEKYDATQDVIERSIDEVLNKLRKIGALDE